MDSYHDHPGDFGPAFAGGEYSADSARPDIGTDERRMHVRAYNYWASLLDGRDYPSIEDLEPGDLKDFAPHSVLLDFTVGRDNPATPYIGEAIRAECGLAEGIQAINDVPGRSLLSRLTGHYMQIIANRAPVGFEAEFVNQRGDTICYRGILMPFSSDGDTIDFIYGVINWKAGGEVAEAPPANAIELAPLQPQLGTAGDEEQPAAIPIGEMDEPEAVELGDDAGLGDLLWAARENAEAAKAADGRSRSALYRALSHAYDFALAGKQDPVGFAELLEESGMKPQARAPMTPVVKLVFGIDYAKARLTDSPPPCATPSGNRSGWAGSFR
ncbi:MAG: hypothetical protein WKF52_05880 [Sphingomicrobium sp.]